MAVTHADLAPSRKSNELGSKTGFFVIFLSILLGLCCFVLCLIGETTRSEVTWMARSDNVEKNTNKCTYNHSEKTPLFCASAAFSGLAAIVVLAHIYLLVVVTKSPQPELMYYDINFGPAKILTWQARFFFVSTWVSFAVGETLLLIGLCVESGHLKNWLTPQPNCLILRQGVFSAASIFSLITVIFVVGLHITALRIHRLMLTQEKVRQEVVVRENRNVCPWSEHSMRFCNKSDLV